MSNFKWSQRSMRNMEMVHPDLIEVMNLAITTTHIDFGIIEGARSRARQLELFNNGASTTMNSLHLIQKDGYAHAVDVVPFVAGKVRWDWPLYFDLAVVIKQAAKGLNIPIEWGGDWDTFKDGPHWQLPRGYSEDPKCYN